MRIPPSRRDGQRSTQKCAAPQGARRSADPSAKKSDNTTTTSNDTWQCGQPIAAAGHRSTFKLPGLLHVKSSEQPRTSNFQSTKLLSMLRRLFPTTPEV